MAKNTHIINFDEQLVGLNEDTKKISNEVIDECNIQNQQKEDINAILDRMGSLASQLNVDIDSISKTDYIEFEKMNLEINTCYEAAKKKKMNLPQLSSLEMFFSVIAGVLSTAIDIAFVGTPDVVKLRNGKESFEGSVFTSILRKIGSDPNSNSYAVFHWLSEKCKVSYDLSAVSEVVTPNNHRIRSLGHDPLFGLFFAAVDITLETTTCIDNSGHLRVLVGKNTISIEEKFLSVFYYMGHTMSDICTARGIPVPGFFLTQFFTGDGKSESLARKAEKMYYNGYDMRHLASSSVPVIVKNLLIDAYLLLTTEEVPFGLGIAEKEILKMQKNLKREKMLFVSDCVAAGGNLGKIFLPPNCGNFAALNYVQWGQLIHSSLAITMAVLRDTSVEDITETRKLIDDKWDDLISKS